MDIQRIVKDIRQIDITVCEDDVILGRASVIIGGNKLHTQPFALLEDVFVEQHARHNGVGNKLLAQVKEVAQEYGCYKLIATSRVSRSDVHAWYKRQGFIAHGTEFRLDF